MERQYVVTHTVRQTEFPALLDSWVTNTPSVKTLSPEKNCLSVYFHNILKCWSTEDRLSFFCLLYNCVSMGYNKLLFHERYTTLCVKLSGTPYNAQESCPNFIPGRSRPARYITEHVGISTGKTDLKVEYSLS
jgi:hypothetical protein